MYWLFMLRVRVDSPQTWISAKGWPVDCLSRSLLAPQIAAFYPPSPELNSLSSVAFLQILCDAEEAPRNTPRRYNSQSPRFVFSFFL